MQDFNPNNCPVGLVHDKEIEHTKDILNMAIQRLEEHIETIKVDMAKGFADTDAHFSAVDKRFDVLEQQLSKVKEDLPETIDNQIKSNNGAKALAMFKWVVISLGGSVAITLITRWILQLVSLS